MPDGMVLYLWWTRFETMSEATADREVKPDSHGKHEWNRQDQASYPRN